MIVSEEIVPIDFPRINQVQPAGSISNKALQIGFCSTFRIDEFATANQMSMAETAAMKRKQDPRKIILLGNGKRIWLLRYRHPWRRIAKVDMFKVSLVQTLKLSKITLTSENQKHFACQREIINRSQIAPLRAFPGVVVASIVDRLRNRNRAAESRCSSMERIRPQRSTWASETN